MDYKKGYLALFNAITDANKHIKKANEILNNVQLETEEMYMSEPENTVIRFCFDGKEPEEDEE